MGIEYCCVGWGWRGGAGRGGAGSACLCLVKVEWGLCKRQGDTKLKRDHTVASVSEDVSRIMVRVAYHGLNSNAKHGTRPGQLRLPRYPAWASHERALLWVSSLFPEAIWGIPIGGGRRERLEEGRRKGGREEGRKGR